METCHNQHREVWGTITGTARGDYSTTVNRFGESSTWDTPANELVSTEG